MEPNSASPVLVETAPKIVRKRAPHACLRCRARKVRCDAPLEGPCMNCRLDQVECEVIRQRKKKATRRSQEDGTQQRVLPTPPPPSQHSPSDYCDHGPTERHSSQDTNLATSRHVEPLQRLENTTTEPHVPNNPSGLVEGSTAKDGHKSVSSSSYVVYSDYPFLVVGNLSSIPSQNLQFLGIQGCLHVPSRPILDEFIQQYFLHMHPLLPLLNEGDFCDTYYDSAGECKKGYEISLLVFQAVLFSCSNFVPESTLSKLGLGSTQKARACLYRRAKLLFDFDAESSHVVKSQAALLLASWSFPGSNVPHKTSTPWLSIAIEHAKNADAHRYRDLETTPHEQAVLKRLWWCCILRDRVFSLMARRGIQISCDQFDFGLAAPLGLSDLADEFHRSKVHDLATKVHLARIFELLMELCIVLTDILPLAYPIEERLGKGDSHIEDWERILDCRTALRSWHQKANLRLAKFDSPPKAISRSHGHHDSVILYTTLLRMYYYSSKVALSHYELLHLITTSPSSLSSFPDPRILRNSYSELWDAALGTTNCLERLLRLRLARWLPISAVSCTALPLLLHIFDVEILPPSKSSSSLDFDLNKHRLGILRSAMETYEFQYEGANWINGAITHIVDLKCMSPTLGFVNANGARHRTRAGVDSWIEMLASQPRWYLRLVFTIDLTMSKGRLPDQGLLGNLQRFLVEEDPSTKVLSKAQLTDGFAEPDDDFVVITEGEDNQDAVISLIDSEASTDVTSVGLENNIDTTWADFLDLQDIGETQEATCLTRSRNTIASPTIHYNNLIPDEISGGEGLGIISQFWFDGSTSIG